MRCKIFFSKLILGFLLLSFILLFGCKQTINQPPAPTNQKIELVDCGSSSDVSLIPESKIIQNDSNGVGTMTTKNWESDQALVCFGNKLLACERSKVVVNVNNSLSMIEVTGDNASFCIIKVIFNKLNLQSSILTDKFIECPFSKDQIPSLGCFTQQCGKPGATTINLLFNFLGGVQDINGAVSHGCVTDIPAQ